MLETGLWLLHLRFLYGCTGSSRRCNVMRMVRTVVFLIDTNGSYNRIIGQRKDVVVIVVVHAAIAVVLISDWSHSSCCATSSGVPHSWCSSAAPSGSSRIHVRMRRRRDSSLPGVRITRKRRRTRFHGEWWILLWSSLFLLYGGRRERSNQRVGREFKSRKNYCPYPPTETRDSVRPFSVLTPFFLKLQPGRIAVEDPIRVQWRVRVPVVEKGKRILKHLRRDGWLIDWLT